MPNQTLTFFCRFCYSSTNTLYPIRLYFISLNEGLIMCANQNCSGLVGGQVDLLKLIVPATTNSELTYEQYRQTPYYNAEFDTLLSDIDFD